MAHNNENQDKRLAMKNMREAMIKLHNHLDAFGESVSRSSEKIIQSCFRVGTVGMIHKEDMLKKAEEVKNLSGLLTNAGTKLMEMADRLVRSENTEEVLTGILNYCRFFADQLASEQSDASRMLMLIRAARQIQNQNKPK